MKKLYFGDNLDILKKLHQQYPNGLLDLIYVDPPFNSKRNYNILFENVDMTNTKAQKEAFSDTWSSVSYYDTLNELQELDLKKNVKGIGVIEVKSGNVNISTLRSFIQVVEKQTADIGCFVCFNEFITQGMKIEANKIGSLEGFNVDRIQLLSVEDILAGKGIRLPGMGEMTHFEKATLRLDNKDNINQEIEFN